MKAEKIAAAAAQLLEAKKLLLEGGVAPNGRFVREIEELQANLDLFARFIPPRAA